MEGGPPAAPIFFPLINQPARISRGGPCFISDSEPVPELGKGPWNSGTHLRKVEVMSGFEPLNNAFAERSLTTWVHHRRPEVKKIT